jgi:hypothetical protein
MSMSRFRSSCHDVLKIKLHTPATCTLEGSVKARDKMGRSWTRGLLPSIALPAPQGSVPPGAHSAGRVLMCNATIESR